MGLQNASLHEKGWKSLYYASSTQRSTQCYRLPKEIVTKDAFPPWNPLTCTFTARNYRTRYTDENCYLNICNLEKNANQYNSNLNFIISPIAIVFSFSQGHSHNFYEELFTNFRQVYSVFILFVKSSNGKFLDDLCKFEKVSVLKTTAEHSHVPENRLCTYVAISFLFWRDPIYSSCLWSICFF